ncbi:MAG: hypothetical protein ACRD3M_07490 [Thermoanaerobaculia bacterium]
MLPRFDAVKRHALEIEAPAARVWEALLRHDFAASRVARLLMAVRGYGLRRASGPGSGTFAERLERFGFVVLERVEGRELVLGIAGRFWRPDGGLRRLTREQFLAFAEEGSAKAAWNVEVLPRGADRTELSTETRVACFGAAARRKFRAYWALIEPFSGLTRRAMLRGIRRQVAKLVAGRPDPAR